MTKLNRMTADWSHRGSNLNLPSMFIARLVKAPELQRVGAILYPDLLGDEL